MVSNLCFFHKVQPRTLALISPFEYRIDGTIPLPGHQLTADYFRMDCS